MRPGWESVLGLEVHAQLLTASKLFCGCSTRFGAEPNEHVCPVCAGFPGTLPVPNDAAIELAVRIGLAVGCTIEPESIWDRKNYFYPDLPKGYQISQFERPICSGGTIEFPHGEGTRRVRLRRIHLEEDAGKSIHDAVADASLVDLNRAGVPLVEIVSEPDLSTPAEASDYLRHLRSLLQYLEVCDGNLEQGSFRCDANVSVRRVGDDALGTRTELKNLNSFRAVERAVAHEIDRQIDALEDGERIVQETRLWDEARECTRSMRGKEEAHDYRYFPDPDLPPLLVAPERVEAVRAALPELPEARRARFERDYGLTPYDAAVLTARRDLADYFEAAVRAHDHAKALANWITESILRVVRERKLDEALVIQSWPVAPERLAELVALIDDDTISGKIAKTVFDEMVESGDAPGAIVDRRGLRQVTDVGALETAVAEVVAAHPDKVEEYRGGKEKLFGFFVGQVMKATQGKANPKVVNEILRARLG